MLVFVTQEHIERAKKYKAEGRVVSFSCPLALALKDIFPREVTYVSPQSATVENHEGEFTTYMLSPQAFTFVSQFDMALPVEPGAYELHQTPLHVPLTDWICTH